MPCLLLPTCERVLICGSLPHPVPPYVCSLTSRAMGRETPAPPVFYPTMADMRGSFEAYVESIEEDLEEFGIGRIVPPAGWKPRQEGYDDIDFTVPQPITQVLRLSVEGLGERAQCPEPGGDGHVWA